MIRAGVSGFKSLRTSERQPYVPEDVRETCDFCKFLAHLKHLLGNLFTRYGKIISASETCVECVLDVCWMCVGIVLELCVECV